MNTLNLSHCSCRPFLSISRKTSNPFFNKPKFIYVNSYSNSSRLLPIRFSISSNQSDFEKKSNSNDLSNSSIGQGEDKSQGEWNTEVKSFGIPIFVRPAKLSLSDQAFFLLTFIACTTTVAFTGFVVSAVPTLHAIGKAAISFSKLADTAREELPSTMGAIRLSGMELSDLTLELSDLSHEITDGVNKSAQVVKTAEAGIRQIGSIARQQTMSMIEERASLPIISLQDVVVGAVKKTSNAVSLATKTVVSRISQKESSNSNSKKEE